MARKLILKAGGERTTLLEAEEATTIAERFATELAENEDASVLAVDLSCRSWSDGAIDVILPFLRSVSKDVKILNLDDCIAGRLTEVGLSVMEKLANTFQESNLIEISLNANAMGPRGLVRVKPLFEGSNLQRLYLCNDGLSAESMEILNEIVLADNGRIAKSLTDLQLDQNMIGVEGAKLVGEFVSECTKLKKFTYVGCRPEPDGTLAICEGLFAMTEKTENPVLCHLDLDDCTIGSGDEDAVAPLSKALSKCRQLCYLSMRGGDLENEGLRRVVAALMESQASLTHLFLGM
jgi:Ran GTPase-activating protein (RanGAP) involved in mRNA processing and transport